LATPSHPMRAPPASPSRKRATRRLSRVQQTPLPFNQRFLRSRRFPKKLFVIREIPTPATIFLSRNRLMYWLHSPRREFTRGFVTERFTTHQRHARSPLVTSSQPRYGIQPPLREQDPSPAGSWIVMALAPGTPPRTPNHALFPRTGAHQPGLPSTPALRARSSCNRYDLNYLSRQPSFATQTHPPK